MLIPMPVTVQYEPFSYKYRVRPKVPQEYPYFVSYETRVKGYAQEIRDPLTGDLWAKLTESGVLFIYEGAPWNGANSAFDTESFIDASLAHDFLYLFMELGKIPQSCRRRADKTMRAIARNHGMWWPRRMWTFFGVRAGGASHARKEG